MFFLILSGTVLFVIFCFLFLTADENLSKALINCLVEVKEEEILKTQIDLNLLAAEVKREMDRDGKAEKKKLREAKKLVAKKKQVEKQKKIIEKKKISLFDMIPIAGYRIVQLFKMDIQTPMIKKLFGKCIQFKEKKQAMNYSVFLIASLFGNLLFGAMLGLIVLGLAVDSGMGARGGILAFAVFFIFAVLGYLPYDSVNATIAKRVVEIGDDFPQVVSKITLLTVAGMEVSHAWKLTSESGRGTLYQEMERVNLDLENNVPIVEAYSRFLRRCNNSYTTKLATAIIQNVSKGNSEIVSLFKNLNSESWLEHKHNARRKGEKIQGKLAFPTMLLFIGIIIMIVVPAMSGFNF